MGCWIGGVVCGGVYDGVCVGYCCCFGYDYYVDYELVVVVVGWRCVDCCYGFGVCGVYWSFVVLGEVYVVLVDECSGGVGVWCGVCVWLDIVFGVDVDWGDYCCFGY